MALQRMDLDAALPEVVERPAQRSSDVGRAVVVATVGEAAAAFRDSHIAASVPLLVERRGAEPLAARRPAGNGGRQHQAAGAA